MAWVKSYPLFFRLDFWHPAASMFLRGTERKKDGKAHRYFSVVENRRLPGSRSVQRTVLYLSEINDQLQAAWRKTLDVFDEDQQDYRTMSLFRDDREVPADALDSVQVKLSGLELRGPRTRRVWVMDRGVPSEAILKDMREPERQTFHLVGTPKSRINQHEKKWLGRPPGPAVAKDPRLGGGEAV